MSNIIKFGKSNLKSIVIVLIIFVGIIFITVSSNSNKNSITTKTNENEQNEVLSDNYYWISITDYDYGYDYDDLIISDKTRVFQFYKKNKCNIVTFNDDGVYYDGKTYYGLKTFNSSAYRINKQGIWISNVESCTYEIKKDHIYITPINDSNILYNGEYYKNGDNIEIIWNGEQVKTTYKNIKIEEKLLFYTYYILGYEDIYDYYMFDYDFDEHFLNNTIYDRIKYDVWIENILKEQGLDITIEEFFDFNERELFGDQIYGVYSLEYNLFGLLYSYTNYGKDRIYNSINLNDEKIERYRGQILKLYAPTRKLTNKEVAERLGKKFNIKPEDIYVPEKVKWQTWVNIYFTNKEALKDYLY